MAARIYSLAKELKLDSKVLVDICAAAGVTGKGSALASLTDEEVEQIKSYLARRPTTSKPTPAVAPTAPVRTLAPKAPPAKSQPIAPEPPTPPPPVVVEPPQPPEIAPVRREDYMAPTGVSERVPVLTNKASDKSKKRSDGDTPKPTPRVGATIKLAPLPDVQQPTVEAKSNEPTPQKPDLKLPLDALRASRAGSKPLQAHLLRTHEQRHREQEQAETPPAAPDKSGRMGRPSRKPAAPVVPEDDDRSRGRGRGGKTGVAARAGDAPLLGGREQRQLNRKRTGADQRRRGDDDDASRPVRTIHRVGSNTAAPRKTKFVVELPCTVRSFSESVGIPAQQVLRQLMALGTMLPINSEIPEELIEMLAIEMSLNVEIKRPVDLADEMFKSIMEQVDDPALTVLRPPVITFLGHVDHGKTSLLDKIIGIDVVSGESGGITQHIRAYQIEKDGRRISFVDTPGHEAFTEMRARGANVTDIAVLVVAADDGVMPQTEEAISHARAANVPIVVALNKIDLPGVDIDRIFQQLATNNLLPTAWGGETEVIKTSATKGTGLDELLETLLTIAELHDYKANPEREAYGTCLESEVHEGRGVVAKFMVQNGSLKVGDAVVCGSAYGRIKAMYDTLKPSQTHDVAPPSMPVNITGLNQAPAAGEHFYVLDDIALARQIAEDRMQKNRRESLGVGPTHVTLENLFDRIQKQGEIQTLNIILRADVRGSIEAIQKELGKLDHPEVRLKILQATVGGITEADVHLADASDAVIIGFNVAPDEGARLLSERKGVQIRRYEIIYKITEDMRAALEGMLEPEEQSVELGRALVKRTFVISRVGTVAGCQVMSGTLQRSGRMRIIRDGRVVGDYAVDSLKREKDDAREVRQGFECGVKLVGYNDLKEGDILECYKIEEVARTL